MNKSIRKKRIERLHRIATNGSSNHIKKFSQGFPDVIPGIDLDFTFGNKRYQLTSRSQGSFREDGIPTEDKNKLYTILSNAMIAGVFKTEEDKSAAEKVIDTISKSSRYQAGNLIFRYDNSRFSVPLDSTGQYKQDGKDFNNAAALVAILEGAYRMNYISPENQTVYENIVRNLKSYSSQQQSTRVAPAPSRGVISREDPNYLFLNGDYRSAYKLTGSGQGYQVYNISDGKLKGTYYDRAGLEKVKDAFYSSPEETRHLRRAPFGSSTPTTPKPQAEVSHSQQATPYQRTQMRAGEFDSGFEGISGGQLNPRR